MRDADLGWSAGGFLLLTGEVAGLFEMPLNTQTSPLASFDGEWRNAFSSNVQF